MKITAVEVLPVRIPIEGQHAESVSAAVARVRTDDGLEGLGHAIPFSALHFRSLVVAIEELGELKRQKASFESDVRAAIDRHLRLLETFAEAERQRAADDRVTLLAKKESA